MKKGKFIVVDGGEGSGKGTLLDALKEKLAPDSVVFTREPGGTPLAEKIRSVIFSEEAKPANALTNFLLFWAARSDHVDQKILKALEAGKNVISDRYDISTFAYQIHGQQHDALRNLFETMREFLGKQVSPHMYIYLDVDAEEGLRRARGRGEGNHFDDKDINFHQRVRVGYHEFLKNHPHVVVNANQPIEMVKKDFLKAIESVLAV